jgi:DNA-binding MarR family transcriptional regulator
LSRNLSRLETVEDTFQKLQQVTTKIETSVRAVLAENGIALGGLILLQILVRHEGPLTATELAEKMMVTNGAITGFMDRLEEDGLITRVRVPLDRRVVLVEATEKARAQVERLRSVAAEELVHTFYGWNLDEIRKLQDFLSRLAQEHPAPSKDTTRSEDRGLKIRRK